jgi:hypothetical protein
MTKQQLDRHFSLHPGFEPASLQQCRDNAAIIEMIMVGLNYSQISSVLSSRNVLLACGGPSGMSETTVRRRVDNIAGDLDGKAATYFSTRPFSILVDGCNAGGEILG